jgi:hypothetical protein
MANFFGGGFSFSFLKIPEKWKTNFTKFLKP